MQSIHSPLLQGILKNRKQVSDQPSGCGQNKFHALKTNLQANKIRLQNATAHNLTMLFTFTLILQKVTKSDLLRRCEEAIQAHWLANVIKPPLLKQMPIYGRQDF